MTEAIVLCVFSAIFGLIAFLTRNTGEAQQETKRAEGVITRFADSGGHRNYFISFDEDGKTLVGKSVSYSTSEKRLHCGDKVQIEYYMTKAGWPRVIILDKGLTSSAQSSKNAPKLLAGISAALFVIAVIFAVKDLLIR